MSRSAQPRNRPGRRRACSATAAADGIAEYAPTMLWRSDAGGAMNFLNRCYLDFAGVDLATALRPETWIGLVHPEDRERAMRGYIDALRQHAPLALEYRLRRADGEYRHMLDLARPHRGAGGEFQGYIGCTVDITERKEQERALAQAHAQSARRSRDLGVLYDLKADLQVCRTVEETRPVLMLYGRQLFPRHRVNIYLYNNSRNLVEPFVAWGGGAPAQMFAPEQCWALRKGKAHLEQGDGDGSICPNRRACAGDSYLCQPMTAFGETIGVMEISLAAPSAQGPETEELHDLARMTADEIAAAIEELKLRARLHQQSIRDPLTRLFNRRYLMETLEREIYRTRQAGSSLALLMIDVDHFKRFNDLHGHGAGDAVLDAFGAVLRQAVRGADVPCRYGGEEFAVLMPDCPAEGACGRAEEIRRLVEQLVVRYQQQPLGGITVSIGVAALPGDAPDAETLIATADAALYAAKEAGRNRIARAADAPAGDGRLRIVSLPGAV